MKGRTKNEYQSNLATYIKRREELRKQFNWKLGYPMPTGYGDAVNKLTYRINVWRRQIRRIEAKELILHEIAQKVKDYTGMRVHKSIGVVIGYSRNEITRLTIARRIFCKYAIDKGVNGYMVSNFVGAKNKDYASRNRLKLQRNLPKQWFEFKKYIQHENSSTVHPKKTA